MTSFTKKSVGGGNKSCMNKNFIIIIAILFCSTINAQVLYTESFNTYTQGNVGTDFTGAIPGKGGWLTTCLGVQNNDFFKITSEASKGNVLTLNSGNTPNIYINNFIKKTGIESLIDQRTPGNDVIKFEIDYYTGSSNLKPNLVYSSIALGFDTNYDLYNIASHLLSFDHYSGDKSTLYPRVNGNSSHFSLDYNNVWTSLPYYTWIKFIVYLDYNNRKAYFETPYFNTVVAANFLTNSTSTNLIEDYKLTTIGLVLMSNKNDNPASITYKFDNIKITALKSVPAYVLSAANFLADTFNVFPNPAESVIHITNTNNLYVENVIVYDSSGKEIKKQTFANETNIQLNIENLASGTYMLHLQTNEGLAVKKIIKK